MARLARFKLRSKVDIEPARLAVRGPAGAPGGGRPPPVDPGGDDRASSVAARTALERRGRGRPARARRRVDVAVPPGLRWCGDAAWEAVRIEAGIPVMGRELDGRTIAAEAGLVERTVSFTKGCYTGQELVARLDARGNRVARRLVRRRARRPEDVEPGTLVGADLAVAAAARRSVGTVTSAAWCPGIGAVAALAYVHRSVDPAPTVAVGDPSVVGRVAPLPLA